MDAYPYNLLYVYVISVSIAEFDYVCNLNVIGMIQIEGESWTSAIASILIADEKQEVRRCYRGIFKGYGVATEGEALSSEAGFKRGFTIKYSCHWDCS